MRRLLATTALSAALLAPAMAHAQAVVVSERPDAVAVTIYPPAAGLGLAMITETRTVDLPAGASVLRFQGVADQIVAQTVAVEGLPRGVSEQNFDYQLLGPGSLMRASEGRTVTLVRTNATTGRVTSERARVVTGQNGAVLDIGGRIEALRCSAMPERLVFDDLPAGFVSEPTLSVSLNSPARTRVTLRVSYLATGVEWGANYVARLAPDGRTLDLTSWITIRNDSDTRFPDAPIQVVGGQLQRRPNETRPISAPSARFFENCWGINNGRRNTSALLSDVIRELSEVGNIQSQSTRGTMAGGYGEQSINLRSLGSGRTLVALEDLGDYKLYNLPEPTTLAAHQTKQLFLFEKQGVKYRAVQRLDLQTTTSGRALANTAPQSTQTVLELQNREADGLGLALPRGRLAAFDVTSNGAILIGETPVRDTAKDTPFYLMLGANTLVQAQTRLTEDAFLVTTRRRGGELTLTNASSRAVTVQIRERAGAPGLRVQSENRAHIFKDGWMQWDVPIAAHSSSTLTYALEWQARV